MIETAFVAVRLEQLRVPNCAIWQSLSTPAAPHSASLGRSVSR